MPKKTNRNPKRPSEHSAKKSAPPRPPRPPAILGPAPDPAEFRRQLRDHLAAELNRPFADDASRSNFEVLSEKIMEQALKGKKDFVQLILDRLAGRTPAAAGNEDEQSANVEYIIGVPRPDYDEPESSTAAELPAVRPAT